MFPPSFHIRFVLESYIFWKNRTDVSNIVPLLALLVGVTFRLLPSRLFTFSAVLVSLDILSCNRIVLHTVHLKKKVSLSTFPSTQTCDLLKWNNSVSPICHRSSQTNVSFRNFIGRQRRNGRESRARFNSSDHPDRVSQTIADTVAKCSHMSATWSRPLQIIWKPGSKGRGRQLLMTKFMRQRFWRRAYVKKLYILDVWESIPLKLNRDLEESVEVQQGCFFLFF